MKLEMKNLLLAALCLSFVTGCGGGSSSDNSALSTSLPGSWDGGVSARLISGDPACEYFAGQYPFVWEFVPIDENSFQVLRDGFELGVAEIGSDPNQAVIDFPDLVNELPSGETCLGRDTISLQRLSDTEIELTYSGESSCGPVGNCVYGGDGQIERLNR